MNNSIQLHNNFVQGTPEWHAMRSHRFGGTDASAVYVGGKGLKTLIRQKIAAKHWAEYDEGFTSPDTQRGNDLEPLAREEYEETNFVSVQQFGYISWRDWFGYSPDGLVGEDGLIEIKCPNGPNFIKYALDPVVPLPHLRQMQWGMFITGRNWCDYITYHIETETIVQRIERDEGMMEHFAGKCLWIQDKILEIENKLFKTA